jgi:transposase
MEIIVARQHADPCTVLHCLYAYYVVGASRKELAVLYKKTNRTIGNWIRVYESTGTYERVKTPSDPKYTHAQRQWFLEFYAAQPLAYIDEARAAFRRAHSITISKTTVWRIIHEHGLTWKVLERRAFQINEADIFRFIRELEIIDWCHQNLVFLDEVSFDNRGMIRKRGYAPRGKKLAIRGGFRRLPRISILAFLGVNGLLDFYDTDGTFDRIKFFTCCRKFAYAERNGVQQYLGKNSVWILDGATIHRDAEIVHFFRSVGVTPIFLPAYCPFFNPIEFLFGYVKRAFQRYYDERRVGSNLLPFVTETLLRFENFNMARVFAHCGWQVGGCFDPTGPMSAERRRVPDIYDGDENGPDDSEDEEATVAA